MNKDKKCVTNKSAISGPNSTNEHSFYIYTTYITCPNKFYSLWSPCDGENTAIISETVKNCLKNQQYSLNPD